MLKQKVYEFLIIFLLVVIMCLFVYALTPLATIDSLFINSTKGTNFTNENLTAFISVSNGANNSFIYDWRENNNSLMLLNLGMECDFNNKSRVTDYSTWKNNGTVSNAKDLNCSIFGGYNNLTTNSSGWIFNGINGSVRIEENTNLDLTRNFSYGAWFIMYSQPINANFGIFSNAESSGDDDGYNLEVSSAVNAGITCDLYNTNTLYRADMNAQASINKWYFAVCVMNDTSVTLYIDGVLKETTTASIRHQTTSKPLLGHYYVDGATNLYFNGTIDNLFVINKSLNTSEVVAMNSSGNYNNLLHSSQLTLLNNYSVVITPNNGSINANTSFSNNIFIWDNMTTTLNNITDNYRNIVNATSYGVVGQNASFLVSGINDTKVESVWVVIWKDTRTLGNKIFEGLMSMTGPYWQGNMTLNNSFGRVTNYTIYVNDTGGNINLSDGSFLVNHLGSLNLFINSTYGTNFTNENLSVQNIVWTEEDNNSQNLSLIYDWRENNKSIAVLNLGMECDSNKSLVKDYSSYSKNATSYGAICNVSGGYTTLSSNSSGWVFDGSNDYMATTVTDTKNSLILWIKNSTSTSWSFIAKNDSTYFVDGVVKMPVQYPINITGNNITIGLNESGYQFFSGSIDNVMIFNRSLILEEIVAINNSNNFRSSLHSLASNSSNNYSVAVTPNDGFDDGYVFLSNNILIRNSPPTNVSLIAPINNSVFSTANTHFVWSNATDIDGDTITYLLEIDDNSDFSSVSFVNSSISLSYLDVTLNNGGYYWRVLAKDNLNSTWSDIFTFTVKISAAEEEGGGSSGGVVEQYNHTIVTTPFPPINLSNLSEIGDILRGEYSDFVQLFSEENTVHLIKILKLKWKELTQKKCVDILKVSEEDRCVPYYPLMIFIVVMLVLSLSFYAIFKRLSNNSTLSSLLSFVLSLSIVLVYLLLM